MYICSSKWVWAVYDRPPVCCWLSLCLLLTECVAVVLDKINDDVNTLMILHTPWCDNVNIISLVAYSQSDWLIAMVHV